MKKGQTWLGNEIPTNIRGIIYLCKYDNTNKTIKVIREVLFKSAFDSLQAYANIPNPESQQVAGKNFEELIKNLHQLHEKLNDPKRVRTLSELFIINCN